MSSRARGSEADAVSRDLCRPYMRRHFLVLALALATTPVLAQTPADQAAQSPAVRAVMEIGRAAGLALDGRRDANPSALVEAAEILLENPSDEMDPVEDDPDMPAALEPQDLLFAADSLAGADSSLASRIHAAWRLLPAPAKTFATGRANQGAESGPTRQRAAVRARGTNRHELYFNGSEVAVIQVRGSGSSNLDIILLDVNGDRVAADEGPSDVASVHWYVPYTQTLTLVVSNNGTRSNGYYLITN